MEYRKKVKDLKKYYEHLMDRPEVLGDVVDRMLRTIIYSDFPELVEEHQLSRTGFKRKPLKVNPMLD